LLQIIESPDRDRLAKLRLMVGAFIPGLSKLPCVDYKPCLQSATFVLLNYLNKLLREHLVDAVLEQLEVVVVVT
jgi:hypothetical protein